MSIQTHLAALERRHLALQQEISGEQTRSSWDELKLAELKRRKLIVKDEIACLRQDAGTPASAAGLSAKAKKRTATRAAKLKSSSWYEEATRLISIVKRKPL